MTTISKKFLLLALPLILTACKPVSADPSNSPSRQPVPAVSVGPLDDAAVPFGDGSSPERSAIFTAITLVPDITGDFVFVPVVREVEIYFSGINIPPNCIGDAILPYDTTKRTRLPNGYWNLVLTTTCKTPVRWSMTILMTAKPGDVLTCEVTDPKLKKVVSVPPDPHYIQATTNGLLSISCSWML